MPAVPSSLRDALRFAHLLASVGWMGALLVFLAHAAAAVSSRDEQVVRAAAWAMDTTAWFVILPLCIATVLTGVVQALAGGWGLARHWWIVFKLVLAAVTTGVLLVKLGPIASFSDLARQPTMEATDADTLRMSLLLHAAGGLVLLGAAAGLGVYKPAGLTPWGRSGNAGAPARSPRWVRVSLVACALLAMLLLVMIVFGRHGPAMHGA